MKLITDKDRIEFLQKQIGVRKRVICRQSTKGRGWRLHETGRADGVSCVREAIDKYMEAIEEFAWRNQ